MKIKFIVRILCAVVSILFLFACGGGGGGGGEDTYTTKPTITSVKLFQFWTDEGGVIEQSEFNIGDSFRVEIIANDPDLDMRTLYASEFLLPNIDTPYRTYDAILPPQDKTQMEYWTEWGTIEGPSGNYKACFWIVDRAGNESNEFCINVVVGGSGGGSGPLDFSDDFSSVGYTEDHWVYAYIGPAEWEYSNQEDDAYQGLKGVGSEAHASPLAYVKDLECSIYNLRIETTFTVSDSGFESGHMASVFFGHDDTDGLDPFVGIGGGPQINRNRLHLGKEERIVFDTYTLEYDTPYTLVLTTTDSTATLSLYPAGSETLIGSVSMSIEGRTPSSGKVGISAEEIATFISFYVVGDCKRP